MDEFSLIGAYFKRAILPSAAPQIDLSVGDDAALFRVAQGHQCVVSSDMLVQGRHFFADVSPRSLGHKALAVNLSDLAAMGAQPIGFTLSIGLPCVDEAWLAAFSAGLFALADAHNCPLIGGDTTKSEHTVINITIFGQVPTGSAVLRSGAQVGDDVWVTGTLGDAAYALSLLQAHINSSNPSSPSIIDKDVHASDLMAVRARLEQPTPRVALGRALRESGLVHSMLDVSDGMAGDLPHILRASQVSAQIDCTALPLSSTLRRLPIERAWPLALTGGDDYELCLTAPATEAARATLAALAEKHATALTRVGTITPMNPAAQIQWLCDESAAQRAAVSALAHTSGYNHFAQSEAAPSC